MELDRVVLAVEPTPAESTREEADNQPSRSQPMPGLQQTYVQAPVVQPLPQMGTNPDG